MRRHLVPAFAAVALLAAAATAHAENLLVNPGFDRSLQGWTVIHDGATTAWQQPDADGSPGSGSAKVTFTAQGFLRVKAFSQCVPVTAGTPYALSAKIRTQTPQAALFMAIGVEFDTSADCTGTALGGNGLPLTPPTADWTGVGGAGYAPDGAQAALVVFTAQSDSGSATFELDDLYFGAVMGGSCTADASTLCLDGQPGDHRFAVRATFSSPPREIEGTATAVSTSTVGITRGGLLWFFDPTNPELLVKVIDGCALTGHFWVYISAGTDVGVELTITDTKPVFLSSTFLFRSPDGTAFPSIQNAFAIPCG